MLSGNPEPPLKWRWWWGAPIHICLLSNSSLCCRRRREHSRSTCLLGQRRQSWSNPPHPRHRTCSSAVKAAPTVSSARVASPARSEEAWAVARLWVRPQSVSTSHPTRRHTDFRGDHIARLWYLISHKETPLSGCCETLFCFFFWQSVIQQANFAVQPPLYVCVCVQIFCPA